jgi:glycosyltransferase involved in cell wall biosynthesis
MRIDLITKEYPPFIYGGAGVHVAELVRVLRKHIDVQVRCFGEERSEQMLPYKPWQQTWRWLLTLLERTSFTRTPGTPTLLA